MTTKIEFVEVPFTASDHVWMTRALRLAEQGLYTTMPNPRVGCVIVKDGVVVGEGAHLKAGEPHAEVFALRQAGDIAKGATAYVTLEPCSHTGRTPPCAEALVKAGVAKVIAAMVDPNPIVAGSGLAYLQAHNIQVASGLMQDRALALNPGFISRMSRKLPYVRCKIASSLDGKTALNNGNSQWITSEAARLDVQKWRAQSCAILTGIGTVLNDDPAMTVRSLGVERQPLRVIVDSQLRISPQAKILQGGHTLIVFAQDPENKASELLAARAELISLPNQQNKVCLKSLLSHLAHMQINEVLVEGGENLNGALLAQNLIDELLIYYAPKLMGSDAKSLFAMPAFSQMNQAIALDVLELRQIGADIRLRAKPVYSAVNKL
ncbi:MULTISPECIES: bifunctional diaminohydroxyphosphoribosylaminopyrimidine deaminase/5-amino-6-(5-phosphoribosylamino)uracil reductase RibD [Methylotenera]|uniref:bifunctional diaminohydroxyphosphoribosylaminopyrimidine deaminase/5-amino-6-(5-phosphoribosylamino)uracil reductase RibD n=1 Tax=Methylotenera TaxID=359407 RepID=UPI0003649975|nr:MULTISPECIES: bifunctional diaminohydroxyphosphoribosylaminopyrimidine deaminase/5-amino-6-(5-phosphoribosylamino)uracil reductase RibD [Methylotenera]